MTMRSSSVYGPSVRPSNIHDAFARVAEANPHRVAARDGDRSLTYGRIAADARRVATWLRRAGVGSGDLVPVISNRDIDLPAVLLGILSTGAAYGMLDPRWPALRHAHLLDSVAPAVVVAETTAAAELDTRGVPLVTTDELLRSPDQPQPRIVVHPQQGAAVFWTSGSTGAPKGVLSPHQATTRLFATPPFLEYGPEPVVIHAAAVAWDAFSLELWGALLRGGTLLVHARDLLLPNDIRAHIRDGAATHLFLTPALAEVVVGGDVDCLAGLRCLMLGGDKPDPHTCERLLSTYPNLKLINGYGPVESCVFATTHPITTADIARAQPIPAGSPVPGTGVHIVADDGPLPAGETGEVALSGTGIALGYLGDPASTKAAFRTLDIDGRPVRVYLTGDRGRIDAAGLLHFSGRGDSQIKVSGHRIEPAEIEAAARAVGARRAVVLPRHDKSGNPQLILFAEVHTAELTEAGLHARLREHLPAYMIPARVHILTDMPLLDNTKIDKKRLTEQYGFPA
ncbi:AMP-binding protein [Nocardia sp. NBC_01377]|uniref:AMP-binding protein n=1 Tax=Nocardia sp. NBC_01377 TaxID=2903595 RepID=UPI0032541CDE